MPSLMADSIPMIGINSATEGSPSEGATANIETQREGSSNLFVRLVVFHEKRPQWIPTTIHRALAKILTYLICLTALTMFLCLAED
jgi:hypothetical protein